MPSLSFTAVGFGDDTELFEGRDKNLSNSSSSFLEATFLALGTESTSHGFIVFRIYLEEMSSYVCMKGTQIK